MMPIYVLTSFYGSIIFVIIYNMGRWIEVVSKRHLNITEISNGHGCHVHESDLSMLLSELKEGESGKITRIGGNGALRRRILEMGLIKDSEIYVEKYAPLKDPIELIVKGYHLSLRVNEASQITVEKMGSFPN